MTHGFWWHLWNDPVRDNSWSLALLALGSLVAVAYAVSPWRPLSREWWQRRRRDGK